MNQFLKIRNKILKLIITILKNILNRQFQQFDFRFLVSVINPKGFLTLSVLVGFMFFSLRNHVMGKENQNWWSVQSIDTMKYSRDLAREKLNDFTYDDKIASLTARIAATGATHIAIGTPYDDEFLPYLKRWVNAARLYDLNVWFRGNWSGWEGWFEYPEITREQHITMTREFILSNPDLFVDGDIFTSCPECENGALGDPRHTGKVSEYKEFLLEDYKIVKDAFKSINKNVISNYYSMNGDVAKLIMDKTMVKNLGGVITVDHYVETPEKLANDIRDYIDSTGAKVVLGEYGAPVPDIHGDMSSSEQSSWLFDAMNLLKEIPDLIGVNYWTSEGSSTALWHADTIESESALVLESFFNPELKVLSFVNELQEPVEGVKVTVHNRVSTSDRQGNLIFRHFNNVYEVTFTHPDYFPIKYAIDDLKKDPVVLIRVEESVFFKLQKLYKKIAELFRIDFKFPTL